MFSSYMELAPQVSDGMRTIPSDFSFAFFQAATLQLGRASFYSSNICNLYNIQMICILTFLDWKNKQTKKNKQTN